MEPTIDRIAREYHEHTEAYDRTVCTGGIGPGGGVMPATSEERRLINKNALAVRRELLERAALLGFTREQFQAALHRVR